MVRVHHLRENVNDIDVLLDVFGDHVIIDAPAEVLASGTGTEAPPAVTVGLLHQITETVNVTIADAFYGVR